MTEQMKKIGKWVVRDYFPPNIKAEVILDTLLTEYIENIGELFEDENRGQYAGGFCLCP